MFVVNISLCDCPPGNSYPLAGLPQCNSPQDSKRFEGIDADFKELANAAHKTPNVVEATNKAGLFSKLEDIQSRWGKERESVVV
jgi:hypothetical protein